MMAGQTYEFLHRNDGISGVLDLVEVSRASRQCPSNGQLCASHLRCCNGSFKATTRKQTHGRKPPMDQVRFVKCGCQFREHRKMGGIIPILGFATELKELGSAKGIKF